MSQYWTRQKILRLFMAGLNHRPQIGQDTDFTHYLNLQTVDWSQWKATKRECYWNVTDWGLFDVWVNGYTWLLGAEQLWAAIFITKHFNVEWQVWRQEKESHSHWHWYTPTMIIIKTTSNKQYSHLPLLPHHAPWEIGLWTLIFYIFH